STHISYDSGSGAGEVAGVENFPYLYRVRSGTLIARNPLPLTAKPSVDAAPDPANFDSGVGLFMQVPDLWNPHDENAPLGNPRPTSFRIVVDSTEPKSIEAGDPTPANTFAALSESNWSSSGTSTQATTTGTYTTPSGKKVPYTDYKFSLGPK